MNGVRWLLAAVAVSGSLLAGVDCAAAAFSVRPPLDGCVGPATGARLVTFSAPDGAKVEAAVLGQGRRGVVLSNESDENLCAWLPFAHDLVAAGFRALLYDYSGANPVAEAAAAAAELRRLGAATVALAGASEGAKVSIVAASRAHAVGVASISAERYLSGFGDVVPAARRLRTPVLYLTAKHDPFSKDDTPLLYRVTRERSKRLVVLPGIDHGIALLSVRSTRRLVVDFLRSR